MMRFIVANYGSRHAGMLLAFLQSVAVSHPAAKVAVYWQDMPARLIGAIRAAFPSVDFVETAFDFAGDPVSRIASKVLCWSRAAEEFAGEEKLVFADADTLVRRDLAPFFAEHAAEVIFTHKPDESAPLNTGVMLARGGPATAEFFRAWRERTFDVLRSPELLRQATNPALPYAAPDQMSFFQLLGYERGRTDYTVGAARAHAELCSRLNETNSRPLADDIHVIHYKAGWQQILLRGRPFSKWRPRVASWEMLTFFLETFRAALARANASTGDAFTARDFGIAWPWYWRGGKFSAPAYAAWRVKAAAARAWLIVSGKMKPGM
jgi:hypothetical protein